MANDDSNHKAPKMPQSQIIYGEIVYWITVVSCLLCMIGPVISVASPEKNVLNPYKLFNDIFAGKSAEEVWAQGENGFPGGHFYMDNLGFGDAFTQLGLAMGCSCALWGLLAAAAIYAKKKIYIYLTLSLWVATLVVLSMIGIVGAH